jgi:hypothetical protein
VIETQRLRHNARMRRFFLGVLGVAALAGAVGACAAIAGLSPYSAGECPGDGCDASVVRPGDEKAETDGRVVGDGADTDAGESGSVCAEGVLGDSNNCGGCGPAFACTAGQTCVSSVCTSAMDGGGDSGGGCPDGGCPCIGGCSSAATGFSCTTLAQCNSTTGECSTSGGCFCFNDTQCKSGKCVKVARENDVSCGSNCTGTGSRDGVDCELASPGIPPLGNGTFSCSSTPLSCDPTHTNCYCTADSECPTGKCVSGSSNPNHGSCSSCSGTGTADYRGCQTVTLGSCLGFGCPANSTCATPSCYCTSDVACASGHCIPSYNNYPCTGCTGTTGAADDGHGCQPPPSSIACVVTGGNSCTTTLAPPPVVNSGKTACLCVADSDCSSKKCVNKDSQCTGTCTGTGSADSDDCVTATSVANAWSCVAGNCSNVSSPTGQCTAAGIPCWCTSDTQCPDGTRCAAWSGCAAGACTGAAATDAGAAADAGADAGLTSGAFHCVPSPRRLHGQCRARTTRERRANEARSRRERGVVAADLDSRRSAAASVRRSANVTPTWTSALAACRLSCWINIAWDNAPDPP